MTALYLSIAVLSLIVVGLVIQNFRMSVRLRNIENEATGRLDILDDQMSDLGGAVIVIQRLTGGPENQGIREIDHDYNGNPFSPKGVPPLSTFKRSGDMYLANPAKLMTAFTDESDFPNVPEGHLQPRPWSDED